MISMIAPLMYSADAAAATSNISAYVSHILLSLGAIAILLATFFIVLGGIRYSTSAGNPAQLATAKLVIRNALIGLVLVLGAGLVGTILTHTYVNSHIAATGPAPLLAAGPPVASSNSFVDTISKTVTGFLLSLVTSAFDPVIKALQYFLTSTPLMAQNTDVFNLWLVMVGLTDALFGIVVALLGFHVMSYATLGLDELEFKHLLPKLSITFLLINISIFAVDGVIGLSNAMILALHAGFAPGTVWDVLSTVAKQADGFSLLALLVMIAFVVLAVLLLVYYVGRLITLYVGAVMAPLVVLLWLVPGFRDFSESAAKMYATTIFVLLVHVVILELAATLLSGLIATNHGGAPDPFMSIIVGVATLLALLKTQGMLSQLSYVSSGAKMMRQLGGQFVNSVSHMSSAKPRPIVGHRVIPYQPAGARVAPGANMAERNQVSS
jgi:hypothetical protein